MKSSLANIKGLSAKGITSDRGLSKGAEINVPPNADPQMRQTMDELQDAFGNIATPFPEEPIGPGAKWEAKMPIKSQGMNIDQTVTYEIVSLEGDHLAIRAAIAQTAPKQKMQSPAMPGVKLDLLKMSGSAKLELALNLGQLMPSSGSLKEHTELSLGTCAGAQQQTMSMNMDQDLQLEAK